MHRKPVIGVSIGRYNLAAEFQEPQAVLHGCPSAYPEAVARSGGAPVLLPRTDDKDVLLSIFTKLDGLLLTGGGDVVSLAFGAEPHPKNSHQDPLRDRMELAAVNLACKLELPILGICRGVQALSVAFGGSLVQDIPSQVPGALQHYTHARDVALVHTVDIEQDSLLAGVLGLTSTPVSSRHHQAVKEPGKGMRVNCRARDGVIEGLEAADRRPLLGVQFHAEDCCVDYPLFQKLFDWLVAAAARESRV